jgi:DNA-binding CsgD family transcriptional regulator
MCRSVKAKGLMNKTPSPAQKTVCVISAPQLQNQFIARCLETRGDVNCLIAKSLGEARSRFGTKYNRIPLFLFDCWEKNLACEVEGFKDVEDLLPKNSVVGLFNVDRKHRGSASIPLPPQVKGIFSVGVSVEDFLKGVSCMLQGNSWLAFDQGVCVDEDVSPDEPLKPTEKAILSLIQQGKSNQEIADALGLKYQTVKKYCSNLFEKLNVSNRLQASLLPKKR